MGKFLGVLTILFTIAFALVILPLLPALWDAVTNGGSWAIVGLFVVIAIPLLVVGTILDNAAKRRGWNTLMWKPVEQKAAVPKNGPDSASKS